MKIGFSLIRKEADTYRLQGLHEEALELYAKFVVGSAKIDPATKYLIKRQVQFIEEEMNRGDSGATQELPAERSALNKKSGRDRAIESDFSPSAEDKAQPPGRSQKDETDIEGADWLDPLADIYALVSNDMGEPFSEKLNGKAFHNVPEESKTLLAKNPQDRKLFHGDYTVKSFIKSIVAFVLVGSLFLYFVDWFSEVKRDRSGEVVQKAPIIVIKKMPNAVSKEHTFNFPNNGVEDQSVMLSKEKAVIGDTQPVVDPAEMQEIVKNLSSPTNDNKTADKTPSDDFQKDGTSYSEIPAAENTDIRTVHEEPDPASVIDYVLKKRGR
jgi:hypothetical protein